MTISEALLVLEGCDWLKISGCSHVSASKWKTREEMWMLPHEARDLPHAMYRAHVRTRRKRGESFEGLLIRAAEMVAAGHIPAVQRPRRPPLTSADRCACGASGELVWNNELKQRSCRRCWDAWFSAAKHNDMAPIVRGGQPS